MIAYGENIKVFCGNSNPEFAKTICKELGLELGKSTVKTFADLIYILIDLDRRGLQIKGNTTYSQRENQLMAHLSLDIKNAQLATFIPDWNSANKKLASGLIDELEYANWLEDILRIFNVTIDDFI